MLCNEMVRDGVVGWVGPGADGGVSQSTTVRILNIRPSPLTPQTLRDPHLQIDLCHESAILQRDPGIRVNFVRVETRYADRVVLRDGDLPGQLEVGLLDLGVLTHDYAHTDWVRPPTERGETHKLLGMM